VNEPRENVLIRKTPASSVASSFNPPDDDYSSIKTAELEEQENEIISLAQLQAQAKAEAEAEVRRIEQEKADKIRKVQEHNDAVRKRVKEAQDKEDKLPHGSAERDAARKERQAIEKELIR
jgi:hypothetical protein